MTALSVAWFVAASGCSSGANGRPRIDPNSCAGILANERSVLSASERIPPTSASNGYRRYATLDSPRDVTLGLRGTSAGTGLLEVYAAFEQSCGRRAADRMTIFDAWAQVLRDQALQAVQQYKPDCEAWSRAGARYDIALDAEMLQSLAVRFGSSDSDVSHVAELLNAWAKKWNVRLPEHGGQAQLNAFINAYARVYDAASAKAPASC